MISTPPLLPFHLVQIRPWPFLCPLSAASTIIIIVIIFTTKTGINLIIINNLLLLVLSFLWWRDITREATKIGDHSKKVQTGLAWAIILFITSEVIFFSAFFWAFFHRRLRPSPELGCIWPPKGISPLNPFAVPLINTGLLLRSGVTVTWAHHRIISSKFQERSIALIITIILGLYFTIIQAKEYSDTRFSFNDRVYGSTFFIATGFHGAHVIVGTRFLLYCWVRHQIQEFSSYHYFGFEAAAWYWHFVDVIWICLFICIYWWGAI